MNLVLLLAAPGSVGTPGSSGAPAAGPSWLDTVMEWANVETTWHLWLIVFGIFAQALFFGRWLVQWIATERRGESHMPELFWWMSLGGASLLLVYFFLRGEPVGILGQSIGWSVYSRNLYLIHKRRREGDGVACPQCGSTDGTKRALRCAGCGHHWVP